MTPTSLDDLLRLARTATVARAMPPDLWETLGNSDFAGFLSSENAALILAASPDRIEALVRVAQQAKRYRSATTRMLETREGLRDNPKRIAAVQEYADSAVDLDQALSAVLAGEAGNA